MENIEIIRKYIAERYRGWLDYSNYHCSRAGIPNEGVDVLNEVLCDLLQKPIDILIGLYNRKGNEFTELDFFVLRMIKLNAVSLTSPYRHKYRYLSIDREFDYSLLQIEDKEDESEDIPAFILEKTQEIRDIIENLDLSPLARKVFEHRFLHGEPFTDWDGPESEKYLYETYAEVVKLIQNYRNGKLLL